MSAATQAPEPPSRSALWPLLGPSRGSTGPAPRPAPGEPSRPGRQVAVTAVLLFSSLLLVAAITSTRRGAPAVTRQRGAIEAQIAARTQEVEGLLAARQRLRAQIAAARGQAAVDGARARRLASTVGALAPVTGAVGVVGPGVALRLDDPDRTDRAAGGGSAAHRITDSDLAQVVNVLWSAGAEAVAVNGVRLSARTAIRSAGDAILVNLRPLSPPYTVQAVGPPDGLAAGYANSSVAARLRTAAAVYGSSVSVRVAERLSVPAATRVGS